VLGGGVGFLSVYLTGVGTLDGNPASTILPNVTSASQTASSTVFVTTGQTTVTASPTGSSSTGSSGISGGAVAGIVIAILLIAGIAGATIFYIRRRRKAEYEKHESSAFGSSPGSLSRPFAGIDSRLDPNMVQRPQSVGSLADDRDYSRKILRVHKLRGFRS
jgi:cell wall integrity and stress response component